MNLYNLLNNNFKIFNSKLNKDLSEKKIFNVDFDNFKGTRGGTFEVKIGLGKGKKSFIPLRFPLPLTSDDIKSIMTSVLMKVNQLTNDAQLSRKIAIPLNQFASGVLKKFVKYEDQNAIRDIIANKINNVIEIKVDDNNNVTSNVGEIVKKIAAIETVISNKAK